MTRWTRIIRRTVLEIENWRARKVLRRACPWLCKLDADEKKARGPHKRGAAAAIAEKERRMRAVLGGRRAV